MATLLSEQLQQALLDIQMRKKLQDPNFSSFSATGNGYGASPSQNRSLQDIASPRPTSSNLPSSQPFSDREQHFTSSVASLPLQHISDNDQVSFHNPILQYINDILMEEDIGEHKCMLWECTSFQATAKGFYDILEAESYNGSSRTREGPAIHADGCSEGIEDPASKGSDPTLDEHAVRSEGYHMAGVFAQEHERALNRWGDEDEWRNGSPHVATAAAASVAPSSVGKFLPPSPQKYHYNDAHHVNGLPLMKNPMSYGTSVQSSAAPMGPGNYPVVSEPRMPFSPLHESHSQVGEATTSEQPFRRSDLDARSMHVDGGGRKVKRASSQVDSADAAELRPRSSLFSARGSIDAMVARSKEEVVSYVQNNDLNAEKCAKVLNDGLGAMVDRAINSHPSSMAENADRETWDPGNTIDLNGLLVQCAHAVAESNIQKAHELLQMIRRHTSLFGSGKQRMAHYFSEGLVARLSNTGKQLYTAFTNTTPSAAKMLKAYHLLVDVCPFIKIAHYFANKTILEAAEGASRLHIVDYGILYGLQWPFLISALAERRGGPPRLRITGIDFPRPGIKFAERVEITGRRLSEYAKTYGVPFEYQAIASKWETIEPSSLHLQDDETLVVNCMFRLRHLLDETVVASSPRKTVLSRIQAMNPKVFVQGVRSANLNSPFFMSRFEDALTHFSSEFDMMDATVNRDNQERMTIEREMMGRDIINVVACEGPERLERSESHKQWENRTRRAGFEQVPLDQNMLKDVQALVSATYSKNFSVDQDGCWMVLGWKDKMLYGLSAWRPNGHT